MIRRTAAACVAAFALVAGLATPASALIGAPFADSTDAPALEKDAVVYLNMQTTEGIEECTGTAISPRWVITADHCFDENRFLGAATVRHGQGAGHAYQVNDIRRAKDADPRFGDVLLVHVTEDLGIGEYPKVNDGGAPDGATANVYGWSSLGQGRLGRLPVAKVQVQGKAPNQLNGYHASEGYVTKSAPPAQLQHGDSGGPLFIDGEIHGVLSAGISDNPSIHFTVSGTYIHAKTEGLGGWIAGVLGSDPADAPKEMPAGDPKPGELPTIPGSREILDVIGQLPVGASGS